MPVTTPPAPRPAMALPRMKAMELGAAPQRADPTMKRKSDSKNSGFAGRNLYSLPKTI